MNEVGKHRVHAKHSHDSAAMVRRSKRMAMMEVVKFVSMTTKSTCAKASNPQKCEIKERHFYKNP